MTIPVINPPRFPASATTDSQASPASGIFKPLMVEYLHILQRRKWVIAAVIAASVLLALVVTLMMRPVYTAQTRIQVSRDLKNVTNVQGVDPEQAGRDLEFYQTQYSLLEARSLAERVMRRLRLANNDDFFNAHGIDADKLNQVAPVGRMTQGGESARDRVILETLLSHVSINPIRGSALIDIDYASYDPQISAQIANAWASEFIAQSISRKFESTSAARSFLERRLGELRDKVEQSERASVDYASRNNIVGLGNSGASGSGGAAQSSDRTLASTSLEALNTALIQASADRVSAEAQLRTQGSSQTNQTLAQLREERAKAAADYSSLMAQFQPDYPQARSVRQQVDELDAAIRREEGRFNNATTQAYHAALKRESDLRQRVAALTGQVNNQRRASIQYNIFQREADTNRQLYDSLLQRYKEIGVAGVSANNIAIIDQADPPTKPSSPKLVLNLLLALITGAIVAIGAVFLVEQTDEGLRDPTRVTELLGIPLLGSVPHSSLDTEIPEAIMDPKSELSEAYLAIRSSLAFTTSHGVPRSIMLVSTQPAEGKSTSALALASVLQRVGKRVLLIDADLRNPSLHTVLGVKRDQGLSNYLAGEDDLASLVHTLPSGVKFMSAGPAVPSAAELLSGDRIQHLMRELERHYDHVIIDSPPVLGLADAPLLSRTAEAVIFVVETGKIPVRGLRSALARLRDANAPIIGAILTKFKQRGSSYGYGYGYGYGYTYGGSEAAADA